MNARTRFHPSSFILHPSSPARGKPRRYASLPRRSSFILHPSSFPRRGFTLIEILVVVVILTMLAGIVVVALRGAEESARVAKTRATIQKLHNVVMTLYESYHTRRVAITLPPDTNLRDTAIARLAALRDLMRMELPERRSDLIDPQTGAPRLPLFLPVISQPALHRAYQSYASLWGANAPNAPAECLYLIVTLAGGEDARGQFAADEVADTDGNGLYEFIDGWGHPIFFLRWAPGFNDSDLQWKVTTAADRVLASQQDHDPFDPRKVDNPAVNRPAWRLVPLIYSAGPDGGYGVAVDSNSALYDPYQWKNDTYSPTALKSGTNQWDPIPLIGTPTADARGVLRHYDNLHNHRVQTP